MRKHIALAALLMSTALPVAAQDSPGAPVIAPEMTAAPETAAAAPAAPVAAPPPPAGFEGVPGITHKGSDDREDYWVIEDNDFVIARDKVTGVLRIGYVFSPDGRDLSAILTGLAPHSIEDVINSATFPVTADDGMGSLEPEIAELSPLAPEPGLEENDNNLLEQAPEAVRRELLARLVERLDAVKSREEYQRIVLEWREEVRKELSAAPAPDSAADIVDDLIREFSTKGTVSAADPSIPAPPAVTSAAPPPVTTTLLPPPPAVISAAPATPPEVTSTPPATPAPPADGPLTPELGSQEEPAVYDLDAAKAPVVEKAAVASADDAQAAQAYATLATGSRWFGVGPAGAPVIYMVVDPTCPFCSRALVDLEPAVRAGEVQLRIVPAPLLSESASEVVAGVLLSENPAVALFENAAAKTGTGGKEVQRRNFSDLPQEVQADVARNRQNVIDLGITQIPYFAWETADGFRTLAGVPSEGDFQGDNEPLVAE